MLLEEKEYLLSKIISGLSIIEVDGNKYYIEKPSRLCRYIASLEYNKTKEELLFEGFFTKESALRYLKYVKLWSDNDETKLKELDEQIDDLKVELYKAFLNASRTKQLRGELKNLRSLVEQLINIKHSLDYATIEGYCSTVRLQYLIGMSVLDENKQYVWKNNDFLNDCYLFEKIINEYNRSVIPIEKMRELARTEPWRSSWQIAKDNVFGISSVDLTDEQRTLCLFSQMYSNVFSHPEAPSDEVVECDDSLDGWFLVQKREAEKFKNTKQVDKLLPQKGNETFLMARNKDDAKKIDKMNSTESKIIKGERMALVRREGKVKEQHLPDVQRKLNTMKVEAMREAAKKK